MALVLHGSADDICEYVHGLANEIKYHPTELD